MSEASHPLPRGGSHTATGFALFETAIALAIAWARGYRGCASRTKPIALWAVAAAFATSRRAEPPDQSPRRSPDRRLPRRRGRRFADSLSLIAPARSTARLREPAAIGPDRRRPTARSRALGDPSMPAPLPASDAIPAARRPAIASPRRRQGGLLLLAPAAGDKLRRRDRGALAAKRSLVRPAA